MSVLVSPVMPFNNSCESVADTPTSDTSGSSFGELFPDLADLVSAASTASIPSITEGADTTKKRHVIKIKMQSEKDEKMLMEYLLGKSNNNSTPTLELVKPHTIIPNDLQSVSTTTSTNDIECLSPSVTSTVTNPAIPSLPNAPLHHIEPISQSQDSLELKLAEGDALNKNAINARLNRLKKKKYVETLESSVRTLTCENTKLKDEKKQLSTKVDTLENEITYLKGVLANQSELSSLLTNIGNTPGVKFHSTLTTVDENTCNCEINTPAKKRKLDSETATNAKCRPVTRAMRSCGQTVKESNKSSSDKNVCGCKKSTSKVDVPSKSEAAGVCLHVSNGSVSLEFCSRCNNIAKEATQKEQLHTV
ncbi:uncharacterized protein LOC144357987 [Saccoglossus kowalevskii]